MLTMEDNGSLGQMAPSGGADPQGEVTKTRSVTEKYAPQASLKLTELFCALVN